MSAAKAESVGKTKHFRTFAAKSYTDRQLSFKPFIIN